MMTAPADPGKRTKGRLARLAGRSARDLLVDVTRESIARLTCGGRLWVEVPGFGKVFISGTDAEL